MTDIFSIGKYGFKLIGKKTMADEKKTAVLDRELMKDVPMVMYYVATYNTSDGSQVLTNFLGHKRIPVGLAPVPLIFAVYMSESQMGFCRLASFKLGRIQINKGPDYAQSSLINFKLGNFILQNLNHPSIIQYPFIGPDGKRIESPYPDKTYDDVDDLYSDFLTEPNVIDKSRIRGLDCVAAAPSEKCGEMTPNVISYLEQTSLNLKTQFPATVGTEVVCDHAYSTRFAGVEGTIFKVVMQSLDLSKTLEVFVYKYAMTPRVPVDGFTAFSGTIPVLFKEHNPENPEDVSEMGTYANYIPTGAYVCKMFEYNLNLAAIRKHQPATEEEQSLYATRVTSKLIPVNDEYSFVGQLFDGLYPSIHLEGVPTTRAFGGALRRASKRYKTKTKATHRRQERSRRRRRRRKTIRKK